MDSCIFKYTYKLFWYVNVVHTRCKYFPSGALEPTPSIFKKTPRPLPWHFAVVLVCGASPLFSHCRFLPPLHWTRGFVPLLCWRFSEDLYTTLAGVLSVLYFVCLKTIAVLGGSWYTEINVAIGLRSLCLSCEGVLWDPIRQSGHGISWNLEQRRTLWNDICRPQGCASSGSNIAPNSCIFPGINPYVLRIRPKLRVYSGEAELSRDG